MQRELILLNRLDFHKEFFNFSTYFSRSDVEICGLALEAMVNIMATEDAQNASTQEEELALQFAEIFLKNNENVSTLLALLEVYII